MPTYIDTNKFITFAIFLTWYMTFNKKNHDKLNLVLWLPKPRADLTMLRNIDKMTTLRDRSTTKTHTRTFITKKRINKWYKSRHKYNDRMTEHPTNTTGHHKQWRTYVWTIIYFQKRTTQFVVMKRNLNDRISRWDWKDSSHHVLSEHGEQKLGYWDWFSCNKTK